ncbi:MAG: hypothetical protein ABIH89_03870 [Elusimicrobiota bacterium]
MNDHKVIGFFAFISEREVLCDGDACVITGSEKKIKEYAIKSNLKDIDKLTIRKTRFGEIMRGFSLGGAYCFDEEAYNRFYPLARKKGLNIGPEDFSGKTETGIQFARIQKAPGIKGNA